MIICMCMMANRVCSTRNYTGSWLNWVKEEEMQKKKEEDED